MPDNSPDQLFTAPLAPNISGALRSGDFAAAVEELLTVEEIASLKEQVAALGAELKEVFQAQELPPIDPTQQSATTRDAGFLFRSLPQVLNAKTIERSHYYLKRCHKALIESRTNGANDVDLNRWHDYPQLLTDSLWMMDKRDTSGSHSAGYWGNFIPQIPNQLIQRFTKVNDWVLDPFCGSGTTLIEAQRLGRSALGVELQEEVVQLARDTVNGEANIAETAIEVCQGDSTQFDFRSALEERGSVGATLALVHPPYHDIIKFSELDQDLSNAGTEGEFLDQMGLVFDAMRPALLPKAHIGIVIGDKYENGEWMPLGFHLMERAKECGFMLKSVVVKNFDATAAKRGQEALWRYRALVGGFYVFKHEYIFLMQNRE